MSAAEASEEVAGPARQQAMRTRQIYQVVAAWDRTQTETYGESPTERRECSGMWSGEIGWEAIAGELDSLRSTI